MTRFAPFAFALLFCCSPLMLGAASDPTTSSLNSSDAPTSAADPMLIGAAYDGTVSAATQMAAAQGVVTRLLPAEAASQFRVEIVAAPDKIDYFEVDPRGDGPIALRGSSGVSACRGLKWYLNEKCSNSITWTADNINLPSPLPRDFAPHREATPYPIRYIFNNCIFGYSMAFWQWPQWERMLDVLAFNGINMPAMLLGQEKIWQKTYADMGISPRELDNFFAGPAWYPWQWMGNLDGWGGPVPQTVVDGQSEMQKQIVARARSLGMKTVLPGFSGHIPKALVDRNPELKYQKLEWWGFSTYILDWQDPAFKKISALFMRHQRETYGTDHYYNIDPFNEMKPPSMELEYLTNMSRTIFSCIDESDPKGIWVCMTWFAKKLEGGWFPEPTREFFEAVPDDRMLALELWGENWKGTGWHHREGWYGKPWVWSILQDFGDRVDIFGGLPQIVENFGRMKNSPEHGNLQGMGIMTEGLGYNPVVYELVLDMMWGDGVKDLEAWKAEYLKKRYGTVPEPVRKSWDILYGSRYTQTNLVDNAPLNFSPKLVDSFETDPRLADSWKLMIDGAPALKDNPAYQFDLVNLGREVLGNFAPYYVVAIKKALDAKDADALRKAGDDLLEFMRDSDRLLASNEHLLLGRWLADARSWGTTPEDKALLEWGAKRQITDWGGKIGSYAIKEWAGMLTDRALPVWTEYLQKMEMALREGKPVDMKQLNKDYALSIATWADRSSTLPVTAIGDPVEISRELWEKYQPAFADYTKTSGLEDIFKAEDVPGLAVGKPVTVTGQEEGANPDFAMDGKLRGKQWGAVAPASITVDLEKPVKVAAFQVYTFAQDKRSYQYTIEVSADNKSWEKVVDMSGNEKLATRMGHNHPYKGTEPVRYARLNMLHNSANGSVHVVEFKILSPENVEVLSKK